MPFTISEQTQIAPARRAAVTLGEAEGMDETDRGRLALVVTELATNLIKHTNGGEMVMRAYEDPAGRGVEVIAMDKGAGIANVARAMEDGFSTAGTPGGGLGAIRRQSDLFELFSRPNMGTVIAIRVSARKEPGTIAVGAIREPYPGEMQCGDDWAFVDTPAGPTLLLADGSGHGPFAAEAATAAVKAFHDSAHETCEGIIESIHRALRPTRGAAVAVARIDPAARHVVFVGVGNIAGALVDSTGTKRMVSNNGTAGHLAPRIRAFTYPYTGKPTVILHSDGLTAKWDLAAYPGLSLAHPSLLAGVLFRDFRRGRDDASVAVVRGS